MEFWRDLFYLFNNYKSVNQNCDLERNEAKKKKISSKKWFLLIKSYFYYWINEWKSANEIGKWRLFLCEQMYILKENHCEIAILCNVHFSVWNYSMLPHDLFIEFACNIMWNWIIGWNTSKWILFSIEWFGLWILWAWSMPAE